MPCLGTDWPEIGLLWEERLEGKSFPSFVLSQGEIEFFLFAL